MDTVPAPPEVVVPESYGTTRFNALRHGVRLAGQRMFISSIRRWRGGLIAAVRMVAPIGWLLLVERRPLDSLPILLSGVSICRAHRLP